MKRALALFLAVGCVWLGACDGKNKNEQHKLTVTSEVTLEQGGTGDLVVKVDRAVTKGPVVLLLENLPAGVTPVDRNLSVPAEQGEKVVKLQADPAAATGTFSCQLTPMFGTKQGGFQGFRVIIKLPARGWCC